MEENGEDEMHEEAGEDELEELLANEASADKLGEAADP